MSISVTFGKSLNLKVGQDIVHSQVLKVLSITCALIIIFSSLSQLQHTLEVEKSMIKSKEEKSTGLKITDLHLTCQFVDLTGMNLIVKLLVNMLKI